MSKIIAIVNQKGGVGKTTTAVNLSAAIADMGYKTLLIDIDPQANTCLGIGISRDKTNKGIYDLLIGNAKVNEVIIKTYKDKLNNLNIEDSYKYAIASGSATACSEGLTSFETMNKFLEKVKIEKYK